MGIMLLYLNEALSLASRSELTICCSSSMILIKLCEPLNNMLNFTVFLYAWRSFRVYNFSRIVWFSFDFSFDIQ